MKTLFQISRNRSQSPLTPQTWPGTSLHIAKFGTAVVMDFRVRAAGAGVGHFPEVIFAAKWQQVAGIKPGL